MISKNTLKEYNYTSIYDYFNYLLDTYKNGNYRMAKNQFKALSKEQREDFINFLTDSNFKKKINLMAILLK